MNNMKHLLTLCIFLLLASADTKANYACNTGRYLYPNATGGNNSSGDPYYYNSGAIYLRTWDGDPTCGIRDNKISYRTNGDDNCQIVGGSWGIVYYYKPSDNNCLPLPLDDYIPLLVLLTALVGGYFIRNRFSLQKV